MTTTLESNRRAARTLLLGGLWLLLAGFLALFAVSAGFDVMPGSRASEALRFLGAVVAFTGSGLLVSGCTLRLLGR